MNPWTVDAREAIVDVDEIDYEFIESNEGIRNFLSESRHYFVIGTKGFGKSLLLLAKRKKLAQVHMIPEHALLDVPSVKILGQITKEATARLADDDTMVFIWSLSFVIAIIKRFGLSEEIFDDSSNSLKDILKNQYSITVSDIFAIILLEIKRREFYEELLIDYNKILLPLARSIKQQVAVFVDNVDECFENNMFLWYTAQNALIRSIYDLVRVNNKFKIFASIRKEAFLRNSSEMHLQYRGVSVQLEYTREELKDIFKKNIARLPPSKLFHNPNHTGNHVASFIGSDRIPHGFVDEDEQVCDHIFRHTLRRPRDLMEIGGAIYSCDKSDRDPCNKTGLDKFKAIVNDSAANIARSYLGEVLPHLTIGDNDIDNVSLLVNSNVLSRKKLKETCAAFNKTAKCIGASCKACSGKHIFCELYKIGLVGYVKPRDTREGEEQKFLSVGDKLFDDTGLLPVSSYYLIHPAFAEYIRQKNPQFRTSKATDNIVGYDRPWYSKQWPRSTSKSNRYDVGSVNNNETIMNDAIKILVEYEEFNLNRYTVVGGYRRYSESDRASLISLYQQVASELRERPSTRRNYLIYAAPGSGKTYFVEEIVASIGLQKCFISIDISKDDENDVRSKLSRINGDYSCLCMIDEIDGRASDMWPYDVIYKKLDVNETEGCRNTTVFILIGSSGKDAHGLRDSIRSRHKGMDLLSRMPDGSQYNIQIPPLGLGDGICVYISKVLEAAKLLGKSITHVEKMAVYHAILIASDKPRQIKMLADQAVFRVEKGLSVLKYDHHFERGDKNNKLFWENNSRATEILGNNVIKIAN